MIISPWGAVVSNGTMGGYRLGLDARLLAAISPDAKPQPVRFSMNAAGNTKALDILSFRAALLGGLVDASGRINWAQAVILNRQVLISR